MKITQKELKDIIISEIKVLMDDTLIHPDQVSKNCPKCGTDHEGQCGDHHRPGRNLSYGHTKSTDREGRSTKKQLYFLAKSAQSLHDILHDDDDLPEWVQSKVSRAADKIQSAHQYIEYKLNRHKRH